MLLYRQRESHHVKDSLQGGNRITHVGCSSHTTWCCICSIITITISWKSRRDSLESSQESHEISEQWWVTLLIYTTIQSKLQWCLHPFLSSSPHHSQTANVSLQSVLPIIIINMLSNSISLQSMSRWSLDLDDYDTNVNLQNQLHPQHPQLPCKRLHLYSRWLLVTIEQ